MITTTANPNATASSRTCILGVGGAGTKSASMIAKDLPLPIEAVLVDRDPNDLRSIAYGTKVPVGYPLFPHRRENGLAGNEPVDETDLLRVKSAINGCRKVYVLMGLGGQATFELAPSVINVAKSIGAQVVVICTTPFAFEGPLRKSMAEKTLERIDSTASPVALIDADATLSNTASVGNVADELSKALARTLMTLLTIDANAESGALNGASAALDIVAESRRAYVGHGAADSVDELRRAARDAVKNPLASGLALRDASMVSVTMSAPSDTPVKSLNAVMGIIQRELDAGAQVATSFVPLPANSTKVRVSILAGDIRRVDADDSDLLSPDGEDLNLMEPDAAVDAAERALAARHAASTSRNGEARNYSSARALI